MRRSLVWMALVLTTSCGGSEGGTVAAPSSNPLGPTGGNPAGTTSVNISDYAFSPQTVSIKVGTAVTWTNGGTVDHTATADAGSWNSGQIMGTAGGGAYGGMSSGGSYTFTFTATGTFAYHCANHAQMTGTITVTP